MLQDGSSFINAEGVDFCSLRKWKENFEKKSKHPHRTTGLVAACVFRKKGSTKRSEGQESSAAEARALHIRAKKKAWEAALLGSDT